MRKPRKSTESATDAVARSLRQTADVWDAKGPLRNESLAGALRDTAELIQHLAALLVAERAARLADSHQGVIGVGEDASERNTHQDAECMCMPGERCRYHTALHELAALRAEVRAWRWLHWGQQDASWACPCGHAHGCGVSECDDCATPRPAPAK